MLQRPGRERAAEGQVEVARRAAFAVAAEVPDRVLAVAAEAVARIAGVAVRAVEAVVEREMVVAHELLLQRVHLDAPCIVQFLRVAQRHRVALRHHRQRPGLVVQVDVRVDRMRVGNDGAEHAEARHAGLRLQVVLELELEQVGIVEAPVGRQREHLAVALGIAHVRVAVVGRDAHARAELAIDAETLAEIDRRADAAVLRPPELRVAQVAVRALDHQVDQPARRARAGLHAAQALEDLDVRLVVEREHGLGVDRQAVAPEVVAVVDLEAAQREGRPVADRVVRIGQAGVEPRQVGQRDRVDVEQRRRVDRLGLDRRACERLREAGDPDGLGGAAADDLDALHARRRGCRLRGGRGRRILRVDGACAHEAGCGSQPRQPQTATGTRT